MSGKFITLEGLDGAGKSSQLRHVAQRIREHGNDVVVTREPGGTPLGESLRELILSRSMTADTEALLMFASRMEHLANVIRPALTSGRWVLCDRFTDATYAYQGGGRGIAFDRLATLEHWVQGPLAPDLTILLDVAPGVAQARAQGDHTPDRFESEREVFHVRVRDAYLARANASPQRIRIVPAHGSVAEVSEQIDLVLEALWK